MKQNSTIMVT